VRASPKLLTVIEMACGDPATGKTTSWFVPRSTVLQCAVGHLWLFAVGLQVHQLQPELVA